MFYWAALCLVIAIIAAALGLSGMAGSATNIAWLLAMIGIILAIVFAIKGGRPPV